MQIVKDTLAVETGASISQDTETAVSRKPYFAPELREEGAVEKITAGSGFVYSD